MNEPLITRHRPASFAAVRGNSEAIASLERRISDPGPPHTYLFTGPSGVGKTTLARIVGTVLGAEVIEVDAASNSGIDAMRELIDLAQYTPPGGRVRLITIDECQMLSRSAWNAALKLLEEPPNHLYVALCTTELNKVPVTIATRCHHVKLNSLPDNLIAGLLVEVLEAEGWTEVIHDDVFNMVVQEALGSPRRALSLLQAVYDAPTLDAAQTIAALQGAASPLIQIMQMMVSGRANWSAVRPLLARMDSDDFSEGALVLASRYIIGALNREENADKAAKLWAMLGAFVYPANSYDPRSIFYAALGRILWGSL